jgi:hypothetical protein
MTYCCWNCEDVGEWPLDDDEDEEPQSSSEELDEGGGDEETYPSASAV